jgi:hypothetical protein
MMLTNNNFLFFYENYLKILTLDTASNIFYVSSMNFNANMKNYK